VSLAVGWCKRDLRHLGYGYQVKVVSTMRRMERTLQTDRAQNLHDRVGAFFPFGSLALDHPTHTRRPTCEPIRGVVDKICLGADNDDRYARRVQGKRSVIKWQ